MKLLIFRKFTFNHIYFLFYALFTITREILKGKLYQENSKITQNFYMMYIVILSRFISSIPFAINKKLSKGNNEKPKNINLNNNDNTDNLSSEHGVTFIYNENPDTFGKNLVKSTLIVSIFEFLAESLICIFYFFNDKPEIISSYSPQMFLIFNTMTQYLFSYFILNYHFYKHHYLSFGINIFGIIILIINDIILIIYKDISDYQYFILIIMRLVKLILFACGDNYAKYTLNTELINPFSLMLSMALYETIFALIFSIPFTFLKTREEEVYIFVEMLEYFKGTQILVTLGLFISCFAYEAFLLIIIDRFSPSHLPLGFILHAFFNNIYKIIKNSIDNNENESYLYYNFIIYIILFIAAMIHNEIFIINLCGLNKKTKYFLHMKEYEEKKNSEDIVNAGSETLRDSLIETNIPMQDLFNNE